MPCSSGIAARRSAKCAPSLITGNQGKEAVNDPVRSQSDHRDVRAMCDPRHLDPRPGLSGEVPDECRQAPIPVLRASLRQIGVMAARHDPAQHASQTPPVRRLNNDNEFSVRQAGIKGLTIVPAMIQRPPWPAPLRCARETLPRPAPAIPDANIACPGAARAARGAGKCNGLGARPGNGLLALHMGNGLRGRARGTFSCGELCEVVGGADQRPFAGDLLDAA